MGTRNSKEDMEAMYQKRDAEANRNAHEQFRKAGGGGGGGCFIGQTKIRSSKGWTEIKNLAVGDEVLALNPYGELTLKPIQKTKIHRNKRTFKLSTSDGAVGVTGVHSLMVGQNLWKTVSELSQGDLVYRLNEIGQIRETLISNIEPLETTTVYNLIVEDDFTFIADGFFAHSFTKFRELKSVYYRSVKRLRSKPSKPRLQLA